MWRTLLAAAAAAACLVLPALGQDAGGAERRFLEQSEVTVPLPVIQEELEDVPTHTPSRPQPGNAVRKGPSVPFPLQRPDTHNIGSVCRYLGQRETYPPGSLPSTGFGHLQRQADALQRMERSFAGCCRSAGAGTRLECALDGWEGSLDQFCSEEFSIKTRVHDCCRERGEARHHCFALAAPPRSYLPPTYTLDRKNLACPPDGSASPDQDADCDRGHRRFLEQSEVTAPLPVIQEELEDVSLQPGNAVRKGPSVPFPLQRPDTHNIGSVCRYLGQRETYPPGSLPSTGFGHLQRQADALQRMERSFVECCHKSGAGKRLECALDGWEGSLDQFCSEEFSIKTRVHDCCRERGEARHHCFALAAPPRSYLPPTYTLDRKNLACPPDGSASPDQDADCDRGHRRFLEQSEVTAPLPVIQEELEDVSPQPGNAVRKGPSVPFPLQRPDTHNIGSVCRYLGQRETYPPGSLPSTGFSHLQRQADALQRMERSFAGCCRTAGAGTRLECALDGWEGSLDQFCSEEFSIKTRVHDCCRERGEARHHCFALAAPPRSYLPPTYTLDRKNLACPPDGSASPDQDADCDRGHRRFLEQSEVTAPLPVIQEELEDVSPQPGNAVRKGPSVPFPLQRPDTHNIGSVCRYLGQRETYPPGSLPSTGFSHLQRQADALQRMERSFVECCHKSGAGKRLECALDGWEGSLDQFCSEEFSIKTRVHDCCRERGEARHHCFALAAPPRSYLPPTYTLDRKNLACPPDGSASPDQDADCDRGHRRFLEQSEVTAPLPVIQEELEDVSPQPGNAVRKGPSVPFPLQRPDTHNIGSVCRYLGQRETYPPRSLPSTGFSHLQRQADALQRMERSFAECCHKTGAGKRLECALDGWEGSLDQFCSEEFSIKTRVHDCCRERGEARHHCFALAAPPRSYLPPTYTLDRKNLACPPDGSASPDQDADCDRGHRRFLEQSEVTAPLPVIQEELEDVSPQPGNAVRKGPSVPFPLQRPDTHNIGSVCRYLGQRETYPPGSLPSTGFSHLQRQADALQRMERSFAGCCRTAGAGTRLECALDGWEGSLDQFCSEEFSIKTRVHDCCRERGEARHHCFALAAPPRSYLPSPATPPPRPDRGIMGSICRRRFHPWHGLPSDPRGLRLRQGGLESLYQECCLGRRPLQCALRKWSELLSAFCKEPGEAEGGPPPCCLESGDERDACFRESVRLRNHNRELLTVSLAQLTEQTMDVLCRNPLRVASKGPQKLLVSTLRKNCCRMQTPESRAGCGVREVRLRLTHNRISVHLVG